MIRIRADKPRISKHQSHNPHSLIFTISTHNLQLLTHHPNSKPNISSKSYPKYRKSCSYSLYKFLINPSDNLSKQRRNSSLVPDVFVTMGNDTFLMPAKWSASAESSLIVSYLPITLYFSRQGWQSPLTVSQCSLKLEPFMQFLLNSGVSRYRMNSSKVTSWPLFKESLDACGRKFLIINLPTRDCN